MAPAETRQSGSPLASQLGGAAALIGISLPGGQDGGRITNALAVLQSRDFIIRFIRNHNVLVPLFAGQWDAESQRSVVDPEIYGQTNEVWVRRNGAPTDMQAYRSFSNILSVNEDRNTSLVTAAIEWYDPVLAQQWVNQLVKDINQEIK